MFSQLIDGLSQNPRTVTIGVLDDKQSADSELLLDQLKKEIEAVAGQEDKIIFKEVLENNYDLAAAAANYESLISDETDIILAFGVINTMMLYQQKSYLKPIIVLSSINQDFIELAEDQKTSNINNITYLFTPFSFSDDLEAFESLFEYQKLGILIDAFLLDLFPIQEHFNEYFADKEASFQLIPFQKGMDISASIDEIDAVYILISDILDDTEFGNIVSAINQKKLPSFSANGVKDVENGVLLTFQPELNTAHYFRRIALNVEAIIDGVNPSDLPVMMESNKYLSINFNTATQIDFPLRYSMLGTTNFIAGQASDFKSELSYSILDIMSGVLEKNLLLSADKKEIQLSEQDVKISKSSYLPDLNANAMGLYIDPKIAEISNGENPELSTSGDITLQQLLYSEQASANISIQKSLLSAQQEVYNAAQLDALLNSSISYFNALILKTNLKIQIQNLQTTKKNLKIAEQNFELGASGKADILRFQSQLTQNIQNLIDANNSLNQAYNTINQLMNNPISRKIDIDDAKLSKGLFKNYRYEVILELLDDPNIRPALTEFFVEEALRNAPEIRNIGYYLDATKRNYKLYSSGRFVPTVALQGNYNYTFSKSGIGSSLPEGYPLPPDGTYNVGLNLSIPIIQQNQQNIYRQTAKIQEDQLIIQKDNIAQSIEKNINDIVLDLIKEISNIEISSANEIFAKESLELSQNEYQVGSIPVIQLLDAQNNYLHAQLASATAQYNYLLVSMQLERALGYFFIMNSDAGNQDFVLRANQFILGKN